jgi:hypothetical protein
MRYLVFGGMMYYPSGGWDDYQNSFDSMDDAEYWLSTHTFDWWHIIDIVTRRMVLSSDWTRN